jgi:hypothetical protein
MKALMAAPMEPANLSPADLERIFRENHAMVFRAAYRITATPPTQRMFFRRSFSGCSSATLAEPVGNMASFLHRAAVIP